MGESELLLGPHGEGGTEHRGIGIHGDRARCPLWSSLCSMGLEDAQSRLPSHLAYSPKRRQPAGLQEKDGPELGADLPSR